MVVAVLISALQDFRDGHGDAIALDQDFALGDGTVVGEDNHRIILVGAEIDHRATTHPEELVDRDDRAPEHDRDFNLDAVQRQHEETGMGVIDDPRAVCFLAR